MVLSKSLGRACREGYGLGESLGEVPECVCVGGGYERTNKDVVIERNPPSKNQNQK